MQPDNVDLVWLEFWSREDALQSHYLQDEINMSELIRLMRTYGVA
jgi:hypothetical protein